MPPGLLGNSSAAAMIAMASAKEVSIRTGVFAHWDRHLRRLGWMGIDPSIY